MSLALIGRLLLVVGVLLGWKKPRAAFAVFVGLLLGVVIAASHGPLVSPSHDLVDAIRAGINAIANDVIRGVS